MKLPDPLLFGGVRIRGWDDGNRDSFLFLAPTGNLSGIPSTELRIARKCKASYALKNRAFAGRLVAGDDQLIQESETQTARSIEGNIPEGERLGHQRAPAACLLWLRLRGFRDHACRMRCPSP